MMCWITCRKSLFALLFGFCGVAYAQDRQNEIPISWTEGLGSVPSAGAVAPNNQQVAFSSSAGIAIWNLQTGQMDELLYGPGNISSKLIYSADGSILVVAAPPTAGAALVDTSTWQEIRTFDFSVSPISSAVGATAVAISPDGSRLAMGHGWGALGVYNTVTGDELWLTGESHQDFKVHSLAFSGDGSRLICGRLNTPTTVYDTSTGNVIAQYSGNVGDGNFIQQSVDLNENGTVGLASDENSIFVFDVPSSTTLAQIAVEGNNYPKYIQFLDNDTKVQICDNKVRTYTVASFPPTLVSDLAIDDIYASTRIFPSPDGSVLAGEISWNPGNPVGAIDYPNGDLIASLPGYTDDARATGYLPATREYWMSTQNGHVRFYSAQSLNMTRSYTIPRAYASDYVPRSMNSTGTLMAQVYGNRIALLDLEAGAQQQLTLFSYFLQGVELAIFSPDDSMLAVVYDDLAIMCDTVTNSIMWQTSFDTNRGANDIAFSPDGATLYIADDDGTVHFMNSADGNVTETLILDHGTYPAARFIENVSVSPSGNYLFLSGDMSKAVYDLQTSSFLWRKLSSRGAGVWSPDESLILSVDLYQQGELLDAMTGGATSNTLDIPGTTPVGLAFNGDGSRVFGVTSGSLPVAWNPGIPTINPTQVLVGYIPAEFYHDLNRDGVVDCADEIFR